MYKIALDNIENTNEIEELIKVFLKPSEYIILSDDEETAEIRVSGGGIDKNEVKRELFGQLSKLTGVNPDWGILTGVRPVKLAGELFTQIEDVAKVKDRLMQFYLLSEQKADLIIDTYQYQQAILEKPDRKAVGVYIGIPFCPTRCLYCSFTSNQAGQPEIKEYLQALRKEIEFTATEMQKCGMFPESIYIGGGTPTTLSAEDLDMLLGEVNSRFDLSHAKEFTVEAGRPDTITKEKLDVIKANGVGRISINPQSMRQGTLALIGRAHTPEDINVAYRLSKASGIAVINMDIIAGLPEEDETDFADTLSQVIGLGAENITVHTLAVKRASKLVDLDKDFHYKQAETVRKMLEHADRVLRDENYRPYYLYRQKHMAGNFENIGWCKSGTQGVYNIRIMEEAESIIALGAGGITKVYYPEENRLERVANVSNYEIYISRIDEMIKRKKDNLFCGRDREC